MRTVCNGNPEICAGSRSSQQQIQGESHDAQAQQHGKGRHVAAGGGQEAAAGGGHERRTDQVEVHNGKVGGKMLRALKSRGKCACNGGRRKIHFGI